MCHSSETNQYPHPAIFFLVGIASGTVGGIAGGGGGIVTVPVLDKLTSLCRVVIHGTSTIANVFIAIAGLAFYLVRGGTVDPIAGVGMIIGGIIGAPLGARFAKRSREALLRLIFILVLIATVVDLILNAAQNSHGVVHPLLPNNYLDKIPAILAISTLIGIVVGAWSSAMGLGGGLLAVPVLVVLFGCEQHVAEGTSLMIMLPNAIFGAIAHLRQGTASFRLGSVVGSGALCGSMLGVGLALLLDTRILLYVFSTFMVFVIIRDSAVLRRKYMGVTN